MATVTGLTAARMLEIEGASVVDGDVVAGHLILTKHDGTTVDAGAVVGPVGPAGPTGPAGGLIPGEMRMWPGGVLPALASYGKWVWADGAVYDVADYPIAAGHISANWKTFAGASDPGAGKFRVPDMRGLVPAGLDQMPGGARANRMTRAVAITIAAKTGEETHIITVPEMAVHAHGVTDPTHGHGVTDPTHAHAVSDPQHHHGIPLWNYSSANGNRSHAVGEDGENFQYATDDTTSSPTGIGIYGNYTGVSIQGNATGIGIQNSGGGGAHENVQPTVFVPWIVKLDG